jgi:hypothetical protein
MTTKLVRYKRRNFAEPPLKGIQCHQSDYQNTTDQSPIPI